MSEQDFMPIQNFDYIEFYVGDARQAAYYFSNGWGFTPIAYAGLETGVRRPRHSRRELGREKTRRGPDRRPR